MRNLITPISVYIAVAFNIMIGAAAVLLYSLVAQLVRAPH